MEGKKDEFFGRTKARSRAVDVLFEADQKKLTRPPSLLLGLLEERKSTSASEGPMPEYSVRIVEGFAANQREIDAVIDRQIKGTTLDRIPSVDRAVLRAAVWELLYNQEEVPPVSVIDEAIAVAKPVATDESPDFLNGVLDAIREGLEDPWGRTPREELADESSVESGAEASDAPAEKTSEVAGEEPIEQVDEVAGKVAAEQPKSEESSRTETLDDEELDFLLDQY